MEEMANMCILVCWMRSECDGHGGGSIWEMKAFEVVAVVQAWVGGNKFSSNSDGGRRQFDDDSGVRRQSSSLGTVLVCGKRRLTASGG